MSKPLPRAVKRKFEEVILLTDSDDNEINDVLPAKKTRTVKKAKSSSKINKNVINNTVEVAVPVDSSEDKDLLTATPKNEKCKIAANNSIEVTKPRNSFWQRRKFWTIPELLAETSNVEKRTAENIVDLFENENTIPFICRYRRDLVNHMDSEDLRAIKQKYNEIVNLRKQANIVVNKLKKDAIVDKEVFDDILCAKSFEELEYLYAPYKPASKGTLAERARALGLSKYADGLFNNDDVGDLQQLRDKNNPKLKTIEQVEQGICHILSHNISKHPNVLEKLKKLQRQHNIKMNTTKCNQRKKETSKADINPNKYELYFKFETSVRTLKPHQVLAINRAEKSNCLKVKLIIPDRLETDLWHFIQQTFQLNACTSSDLRRKMFAQAFDDCYSKKLQPLLIRSIRADLTETAMKASVEVFAKNLKHLLLMSPLKGKKIMGIDPGFINGCKYAVISEAANVLETGVLHPHSCGKQEVQKWGEILATILQRHDCHIIALGNGKACRNTECWLQQLQSQGILNANTFKYSIVSEQGASIYSCSAVAKKEFPNVDVNEISAVSIARRLNDPLSEMVKIEPRHLGIGMYQHDVKEKLLSETLNDVVSECVSFVGVDINTASLSVLRHVAGLTEKRAESIIEYRNENGAFQSRAQLLKVKSIGPKTFLQCAGFIRIEPKSLLGTVKNPLDCTWVHPESYDIAKKIISNCQLQLKYIGTAKFIAGIRQYAQTADLDALCAECKIPRERLDIVITALQRELLQDYRTDLQKLPLFKQGILSIKDLSVGDVVTGAVNNTTDFGAFVDIGVGRDALLHISNMKQTQINVGDRIEAIILKLDRTRSHISLRLTKLLN